MKQIAQNYKTGEISLLDVPVPACKPGGVLVRSDFSLISMGTETMKIHESKLSLIGKARARPDQVKKVMETVAQLGPVATYQKVMNRLDSYTPLGYSLAGVVVAVGAGADEFKVGQRVACGGNQFALHAEYNWVPRNMCVAVPEGVAPLHAAFTTVGSIAMQGFRQSDARLGETACVIGLGLVGQILVQILRAAGVQVLGIDVAKDRCDLATLGGAIACGMPGDTSFDAMKTRLLALTSGAGADCIFLTAGGNTNQPVEVAAELARDRARIVDIGKCRLDLPWNAYYGKELDVRFSRSYGPGRYDPNYEERGIDYPIGYVRWTERRNMECILGLLAAEKLNFDVITSDVVAFDDAVAVYDKIGRGELRGLGVVFEYPLNGSAIEAMAKMPVAPAQLRLRSAAPTGRVRLGVIGCGNYATTMLLPHLKQRPDVELVEVVTATALSAANARAKFGFARVSTDFRSLLADPEIDAVLIATRHDSHSQMVCEALAGRQGGVRREAARGDGRAADRGSRRNCGDRQRPAHGRLQPSLRASPDQAARRLGRLRRAAGRELHRQRRSARRRQLVRPGRFTRYPLRRRRRPFHRHHLLVARGRSGERAGGRDAGRPGQPAGAADLSRRIGREDRLCHQRRPEIPEGGSGGLRRRQGRPHGQLQTHRALAWRQAQEGAGPSRQGPEACPRGFRRRGEDGRRDAGDAPITARDHRLHAGGRPQHRQREMRADRRLGARGGPRDDRRQKLSRAPGRAVNLTWYARRLAQMSPAEVRGRLADAWLKHRWRARQLRPGEADPLPLPASLPAFASALDPAAADALPAAARARLLRSAEAALGGQFPLFDRERTDLSRDPDWFLDPRTGRRTPDVAYAFDIDYRDVGEVGTIKYVWEPSRHHQLTVLAAAYFLTSDPRFADFAAAQLRSWWRRNPFLSGVHWTSGIELGVRLLSWVWVRRLLDGWPGVAALFDDNPEFSASAASSSGISRPSQQPRLLGEQPPDRRAGRTIRRLLRLSLLRRDPGLAGAVRGGAAPRGASADLRVRPQSGTGEQLPRLRARAAARRSGRGRSRRPARWAPRSGSASAP